MIRQSAGKLLCKFYFSSFIFAYVFSEHFLEPYYRTCDRCTISLYFNSWNLLKTVNGYGKLNFWNNFKKVKTFFFAIHMSQGLISITYSIITLIPVVFRFF
jgi:hypothetical protein